MRLFSANHQLRSVLSSRYRLTGVIALVAVCAISGFRRADGFTFVMTRAEMPDRVVHPVGYTGEGGELVVSVALHPDFEALESDLEFSLKSATEIWTDLYVVSQSISPSVEVLKKGGTDVFGTLIHEIGHCLGLAHPALTPPAGVNTRGQKYAASLPGPNGQFDLDPGPDGVGGTRDDLRGDDLNVNYFKKADNHPFTLPESGIFDSTTYSRNLDDLPEGSTFSAMGDRKVALSDEFKLARTEALMVTGGSLKSGQVRRGLGVDDVAGIRYAMSGLDEIQGTDDDYTLTVNYIGVSDEADIFIRFDGKSPYASAGIGARPLEGNHFVLAKNRAVGYNPSPPNGRFWIAPQPIPQPAEVSSINERAVRIELPTEVGVRYAIHWPTPDSAPEAGDVIVRMEGEDLVPISSRQFFFIAEKTTSEILVAFPESAPDLDEIHCSRIEGKQLQF